MSSQIFDDTKLIKWQNPKLSEELQKDVSKQAEWVTKQQMKLCEILGSQTSSPQKNSKFTSY